MSSFAQETQERLEANGKNDRLKEDARAFTRSSITAQYSYNFTWLSRPVIQYPQDIVAMQEIIWSVQPDLIIETGIAHGGSLIFSASMLELNAACGGPQDGTVLGIDIDIRAHNREAIRAHPMFKRISMIDGSSVSREVLQEVQETVAGKRKILVCLDSNHTHEHVLAELEAYAPFTSLDSYCIVFDTVIEDYPEETAIERPWGAGDNPKTAVREYLRLLDAEGRTAFDGDQLRLMPDQKIDSKLLVSAAPEGYLRRI